MTDLLLPNTKLILVWNVNTNVNYEAGNAATTIQIMLMLNYDVGG
jgi:hypothetical protein